MSIDQFFNEENGEISFTRLQASDFAKSVADDFNPLHDTDAKRFCVPGDLLFALVLQKFGASQKMQFNFQEMVTDKVTLQMPSPADQFTLADSDGTAYVAVERSGDNAMNLAMIDALTDSYVTFSGHTFPHVLVPLMQQQSVMINPQRPMVMYQSMLIELDQLDSTSIDLVVNSDKTCFEYSGKRGTICLAFDLLSAGEVVGRGEKHMLVSGIQAFDEQRIQALIDDYEYHKGLYQQQRQAS